MTAEVYHFIDVSDSLIDATCYFIGAVYHSKDESYCTLTVTSNLIMLTYLPLDVVYRSIW